MRGAIVLLLFSASAHAQQGSLEGTAIHAVTREPLGNVHVRLAQRGPTGINLAYGAMSDRAGHFSIATIRPGTYILTPEHAGFLHVPAKGGAAIQSITIKPGQHVTDYRIEMTPRAVISGLVVDEAGDPVEGVQVECVAVSGSAPMMPSYTNPATDDRGEFRLVVLPGKYYVQAVLELFETERPEIRSDGSSEEFYATTFYPSSLHKEHGTVVEAPAGKDVSGIEIRLARRQQGLSISGTVTGIPEGLLWIGEVMMEFGESPHGIRWAGASAPGAGGRFRFDGLRPGFYRLWALYSISGKPQLISRPMDCQLENAEILNLELALGPPLELAGSLRTEGEGVGRPGPKTVRLQPATEGFSETLQTTGGEVDSDGAFRIGNILPGRYRVKVEPLTENAYVKEVKIDGAAATDGMADLSNAVRGATFKVTIGNHGAQIKGRVLDADGQPMPGSVAVFLARSAEDLTVEGHGMVSTTDGTYTIKGLAPGKYRVIAVDPLRTFSSGAALEVVFNALFERGEEIEFKEGDRITKDLKVKPTEEPDAPKK